MGKGGRGGRARPNVGTRNAISNKGAAAVTPTMEMDILTDAQGRPLAKQPTFLRLKKEHQKPKCCPSECKNLFFYVCFLITFSLQSYMKRGDETGYYLVDRVKHELLEGGFDPASGAQGGSITFFDINTITDIWIYLNHAQSPLRGLLMGETMDNGMYTNEYNQTKQYWANGGNLVMGGARLRQVRVKADSCMDSVSPTMTTIKKCNAVYSDAAEDKEPFYGVQNKTEYRWYSTAETKETDWRGQLATYPGSGYYVDIPYNLSEWISTLDDMRYEGWIEYDRTRAVFIDFQTYNPAVNLHLLVRLAWELPATGGVKPKADFFAFKLNAYEGTSGVMLMGLEVLLGGFVVCFIIMEIIEMRQLGCRNYLKSFWNFLDWLNIIILVLNLLIRLMQFLGDYPTYYAPVVDYATYTPMMTYTIIVYVSQILSATNALLLWIKLFKFLSFSPHLAMLIKTLVYAGSDLLYFSIILIIFVVAFAHCGYLAFGTDVRDFRSISISMISLVSALVGSLEYDPIVESSRIFGVIYFIVFQFSMILILVNVFLAIMNDAYAVVHQEVKNAPIEDTDALGIRGMKNFVGSIFHKKKNNSVLDSNGDQIITPKEVEEFVSRMGTTNGVITEEEVMTSLEKAGMSAEQAKLKAAELFEKYDEDNSGVLDSAEQAKLHGDVSDTIKDLHYEVQGLKVTMEMLRELKKDHMKMQATLASLCEKLDVQPPTVSQEMPPLFLKSGWA